MCHWVSPSNSYWMWSYPKHLHSTVHVSLTNFNPAFKLFLFNVGLSLEMQSFSPHSWKMRLVLYTGIKLDVALIHHLFCNFLSTFSDLINFHIILCHSFWGWLNLGRSETLLVSWNIEKDSELPLLEIPCYLAIARWFMSPGHLYQLVPVFFLNLWHEFK